MLRRIISRDEVSSFLLFLLLDCSRKDSLPSYLIPHSTPGQIAAGSGGEWGENRGKIDGQRGCDENQFLTSSPLEPRLCLPSL